MSNPTQDNNSPQDDIIAFSDAIQELGVLYDDVKFSVKKDGNSYKLVGVFESKSYIVASFNETDISNPLEFITILANRMAMMNIYNHLLANNNKTLPVSNKVEEKIDDTISDYRIMPVLSILWESLERKLPDELREDETVLTFSRHLGLPVYTIEEKEEVWW